MRAGFSVKNPKVTVLNHSYVHTGNTSMCAAKLYCAQRGKTVPIGGIVLSLMRAIFRLNLSEFSFGVR